MAVALGAVILGGLEAAGVGGIAGFSLASTTIAGVGLSSIVGSAVILGASIGLQYALAPKPPGPENGTQPIKQAVPPRIRGYGRNRLAGSYMLFEEINRISYDVIAFHSGRVAAIDHVYLHDDVVTLSSIGPDGPGTAGAPGLVENTFGDGRYGGNQLAVQIAVGAESQAAAWFAGFEVGGIWSADHKGNGIAWLALKCNTPESPTDYTKVYPHGLPLPSVVAQCSPCWDPRNPLHDRADESTWEISFNPIVQLIDYLTRADGGKGLDYDVIVAPRILEWMAEADLCDELVDKADGTQEPRYQSHGWFQYDNNPEDIINGILSTCDGWMVEDVDGTLALKVGVYRAPVGDAIAGKQLVGFSVQYGQTDEQTVNQLDITYTDPAQAFATTQTDPYRDEDSISATGSIRAKPLDLKWVQSNGQASRLAARALLRVNPKMVVTIVTDLTALDWVGERWVPVQYPFIAGLENCVMENQGAEIDLAAGRITFNFNLVVPTKVEDYNPATDEKPAPPVAPTVPGAETPILAREDGSPLNREDVGSFIREDA